MRKNALATLTAALLVAGCQQKPADGVAGPLATNDFENLDGWLADSPALATLNREQAHSGKYSTLAGPGRDYSLGYSNALSRLAPDWPGTLTVGAWVLVPNEQAAAKLVTEVQGAGASGTSLLWQGLDLTKAVKVFNKWQYVEQTVALPATAKPNNRLKVYLWRAESKSPVYLDDLQISLARP